MAHPSPPGDRKAGENASTELPADGEGSCPTRRGRPIPSRVREADRPSSGRAAAHAGRGNERRRGLVRCPSHPGPSDGAPFSVPARLAAQVSRSGAQPSPSLALPPRRSTGQRPNRPRARPGRCRERVPRGPVRHPGCRLTEDRRHAWPALAIRRVTRHNGHLPRAPALRVARLSQRPAGRGRTGCWPGPYRSAATSSHGHRFRRQRLH